MFYAFWKSFCWLCLVLYLPTTVKGGKNIPKRGGFILACNHVSYLDPVIFGISCPRPLNYMARESLFENRLFGWLLARVNVFPIRRYSADIGAIKEALRRLKIGGGLLLFPEGTRSSDGRIGEGLEGVGFLARKSNSPVIPAFIKGTAEAMPKGAKFVKPARLTVVFGPAMRFPEDDCVSDKARTDEIMRQIALLKDLL
jgi:1-acyl-sn-glycerol-3-phosphate acyltransferase